MRQKRIGCQLLVSPYNMPTRLELFLNGDPNGKTEKDRDGRRVTEKDKPFTLWSFDNKHKWFIDDDDRPEFLRLYCAELRKYTPQFLTERSTPIGQLRVDLDLKYGGEVLDHKHTQEQVIKFVDAYMEKIKAYVEVPKIAEIIVLEKESPTYDASKKISSSGVHIQVPAIKTRAEIEQCVRRELIPRMDEFFPDLGLLKGWEDVYDKSPLTHTGNWPLLGSKKPAEGSLPYEIKYILNWNSETGSIEMNTDIPTQITPDLVQKLSVRSARSEETKLTAEGEKLARPISDAPPQRAVSRGRTMERGEAGNSRGSSPGHNYIPDLTDIQKKYIAAHVANLGDFRYTSYGDWIAVGQCLKNIHPDLVDTWLDFSAKIGASYKENEAVTKWNSFGFRMDGQRLGLGSLRYWSKTDNPEGYKTVEETNVFKLVDEAASSGTEYDVAQVIYAMFRDEFKCANFKQNDWFWYNNNIWRSSENGVDLQCRLSTNIAKLFRDKEKQEIANIEANGECQHKDLDPSCPTCVAEKNKKQYSALRLKLKTTKFKESVMKECRALFYDREFAQKVDDNKHLIAFNNGVYDTLNRKFRPGQPDDYISFCTNIDFAVDTQYHEFKCWSELKKFLHSILPNKNVREYFLKHLSTCLSGVFNQRFHILTGSGSNGKSMLMNLCATAFGEYCYKANVAMFTQKRGKAGAANPEMVRMKGKRFMMMSEPDEGEPLSSGVLKELTSSEKVTGRDLFAGSKQMVEFDVQAKMHLACNDKPKVTTNDGGTWRRLKVVDFPNKFVNNPKASNELAIDESIMQKVLSREWAECFMAYLVHLYEEGKGLTNLVPPAEVEAYTNEYKEESDAIAKFLSEYVHAAGEGALPGEARESVSWTTIMTTFHEWKRSNEVTKGGVPELRKRIEAEYGKMPIGGWTNFSFGAR